MGALVGFFVDRPSLHSWNQFVAQGELRLRHEEGLRDGIEDLKEIKEELLPTISASGSLRGLREAMEAINMVTVGQMILTSSLYRTESRGYCQRVDYPQRDDKNWLKNTIITKEDGGMKLETTPVELLFIGPEQR